MKYLVLVWSIKVLIQIPADIYCQKYLKCIFKYLKNIIILLLE